MNDVDLKTRPVTKEAEPKRGAWRNKWYFEPALARSIPVECGFESVGHDMYMDPPRYASQSEADAGAAYITDTFLKLILILSKFRIPGLGENPGFWVESVFQEEP